MYKALSRYNIIEKKNTERASVKGKKGKKGDSYISIKRQSEMKRPKIFTVFECKDVFITVFVFRL